MVSAVFPMTWMPPRSASGCWFATGLPMALASGQQLVGYVCIYGMNMYTYSYIYTLYIYYCIKCIYIYDICVIEQNNFFFQINNRYTYWSSCRNKLPRHFCCSAPEVLLNPEAPSWDKSCEAAVGDFFSIVWIGLLLFIGILIYGCLLISGGSSYIESPLQHFWNLRMDPQRGVLQQWFFFLWAATTPDLLSFDVCLRS